MSPVERRASFHLRFIAPGLVTEGHSQQTLHGRTRDLSEYGCFLQTTTAVPQGTKISIEILHSGARFTAFAQVVYATDEGMGIVFSTIEDDSRAILQEWLRVNE
jgi:hypothetical protein